MADRIYKTSSTMSPPTQESPYLQVSRFFGSLCCLSSALALVCLLLAPAAAAQEVSESESRGRPGEEEPGEDELAEEAEEQVIPPEEPMTPREELFMAIELKDVEAARGALERGATGEISAGDPSPLATAALHDDLRMVALLLDFGGDPNACRDSPLEEAIRNENTRMVELFMHSGARVLAGAGGQELFRLAQRGRAATELSRILLDNAAGADLCLAAATAEARIELMKYCLSRGAAAGSLPAGINPLSVALAGGEAELVDLILAGGVENRVLAGAFADAVAAGRMDLVQRALTAGAVPAFAHIEAALENGEPEICLFLLDQSVPDAATVLGGGDAEALIQRASDLGFAEVAAALRRHGGISSWQIETWLPLLLGVLLVIGLIVLLLRNMGRRRDRSGKRPVASGPARANVPVVAGKRPATSEPARAGAPVVAGNRPAASEPVRANAPVAAAKRPATSEPVGASAQAAIASRSPAGQVTAGQRHPEPPAVVPVLADFNPAATVPIGSLRMMPADAQSPVSSDSPEMSRSPASGRPASAGAGAAGALPAAVDPRAAPKAAGESSVWQVAPEPVAEAGQAVSVSQLVASSVVPQAAAVELRMPEVDLSRDADAVFDAARKASFPETVRPGAPVRRQVVLVTPSRVTMLQSCPASGSLAPEQLAVAERLVAGIPGGGATERGAASNVAVIAYTDLDATDGKITRAIPFFDLLRKLAYLGHAVWIFEGHVSAMAAGCADADLLIVDDGMMPYLPGNWRGVATRAMRGTGIHLFERKTGSLRRLT